MHVQLVFSDKFAQNLRPSRHPSMDRGIRSSSKNGAYDMSFLMPAQFVQSTFQGEVETVKVDAVEESHVRSSASAPKVAGMITAGAGITYGGYAVASDSLMDRNWAWLLIILGVFIGLCFLLAKSESKGSRRETLDA